MLQPKADNAHGWKTATREWRASRRPGMVDGIVEAAHEQPLAAMAMIGGQASLATVRSSWGENALEAASHLGHLRLIDHFRSIGVQLDIFGACAAGDRQLIESEWRPAFKDALGIHYLPLLHFAAVSRDVKVVELLLDLGANPNAAGASLSPLHTAVAVGSATMISRLVRSGAKTTAVDAYGCTPVAWAGELWGPDSTMVRQLAV